jgi:hypothetical protein
MTKQNELKEIKLEVTREVKYLDEFTLAVKIQEFEQRGYDRSYEVEIFLYEDGKYLEGWTTDSFDTEEGAMKRAKMVLKNVKGWFDAEVNNIIELYHV